MSKVASDIGGTSLDRHAVDWGGQDGYEPKVFKFCNEKSVNCVTTITLQDRENREG
jgi:hypothetical protein